MRKWFFIVLTLLMIFVSVQSFANQIDVEYRPNVKVVIDNKQMNFKNINGDSIYPIMYNGIVYLPIRNIGEIMNKEMKFDEATETILLYGYKEYKLKNDKPEFEEPRNISVTQNQNLNFSFDDNLQNYPIINGQTIYPLVFDGITYFPTKVIGEIMNKPVSWNRETATIYIGERKDLITQEVGNPLENEFFEIKVNSVYQTDKIDNFIPESDINQFIIVNVTLKNVFPEVIPMYSRDFRLKWGESEAETSEPYGKKLETQIDNTFELQINESVTGDLIFEAPIDSKNLKLEYIEVYEDSTVGNSYQVFINL